MCNEIWPQSEQDTYRVTVNTTSRCMEKQWERSQISTYFQENIISP